MKLLDHYTDDPERSVLAHLSLFIGTNKVAFHKAVALLRVAYVTEALVGNDLEAKEFVMWGTFAPWDPLANMLLVSKLDALLSRRAKFDAIEAAAIEDGH